MIYLIRHGQTALNKSHALQGRSDSCMNAAGIEQARTVARLLSARDVTFGHVFSSPLQRAVQTARIVAPGVPVVCDERLIEMDYGPYEGMDLTAPPPEVVTFFKDFVHNPAPEGMESLASVVARAGSFMEELRDLPGNVLVSTHAIALKGILEYLTPDSRGAYWSKYVGNCAVYVTQFRNGRFDVPHELR
ncbi:MAG: histidine phosphatase family protein [Atopobiaceae bacterium]|nr:histidine phosphatase family protein [Atopobiaceae bacterium]